MTPTTTAAQATRSDSPITNARPTADLGAPLPGQWSDGERPQWADNIHPGFPYPEIHPSQDRSFDAIPGHTPGGLPIINSPEALMSEIGVAIDFAEGMHKSARDPSHGAHPDPAYVIGRILGALKISHEFVRQSIGPRTAKTANVEGGSAPAKDWGNLTLGGK